MPASSITTRIFVAHQRPFYASLLVSLFSLMLGIALAPNVLPTLIPLLLFVCLVARCCSASVLLDQRGISWFIFTPRWCYRTIPWDAIIDIKPTPIVSRQLAIRTTPGRFEPTLWDSTSPRPMRYGMSTMQFRDGDQLLQAMQEGLTISREAMTVSGHYKALTVNQDQ